MFSVFRAMRNSRWWSVLSMTTTDLHNTHAIWWTNRASMKRGLVVQDESWFIEMLLPERHLEIEWFEKAVEANEQQMNEWKREIMWQGPWWVSWSLEEEFAIVIWYFPSVQCMTTKDVYNLEIYLFIKWISTKRLISVGICCPSSNEWKRVWEFHGGEWEEDKWMVEKQSKGCEGSVAGLIFPSLKSANDHHVPTTKEHKQRLAWNAHHIW
jgi:hypothetical protein